jgi:carbamoylphosphate synthase large subunit
VLLQDFGKFGYIRETDAHSKHDEFVLWAVEVKGANIELLGKTEEKEMFREYMEDFNTGTLPHR